MGLALVASLLPACGRIARPRPSPLIDASGSGTGGFDAVVGVVGIFGFAGTAVAAPVTILDIQPLHTDPGVQVLAVRAMFFGPEGGTSPSGHRTLTGAPGIVCAEWPLAGYGPSYPVQGLRLIPGDLPTFVVYARSLLPGRRTTSGWRIDYQMADGHKGSISGEEGTLEMWLHRPGESPTSDHREAPCNPRSGRSWARAEPGFPP